MLLESYIPKVHVEHRKIDTIKIRNMVNCDYFRDGYDKFVREDMVRKIAQKLDKDGYIVFYTENEPFPMIYDHVMVEARLEVVKPRDGGSFYDQCP